MVKVLLIHGYGGNPNGGWRPWLMAELEKKDIYCCALPMPTPDFPVCEAWIDEIAREVDRSQNDQIYLVGHSLGVPTILKYLQSNKSKKIAGAVLVAGPANKCGIEGIANFFEEDFDFDKIRNKCEKFVFIHGDNDPYVPLKQAEYLNSNTHGVLTVMPNGGHLNNSSGHFSLPEALSALEKMLL